MAMAPHKYVTINKRRNGYEVRAKQFVEMNRLDVLLASRHCRTEASAKRAARDMAEAYGAEILGGRD